MARVEIRWNQAGLEELVKGQAVRDAARAHGEAIAGLARTMAPHGRSRRSRKYVGYREGIKVLWGRGIARVLGMEPDVDTEPGAIRTGVMVAATDFKSRWIEYGTKGGSGTTTRKPSRRRNAKGRLVTSRRKAESTQVRYTTPATPAYAPLRRAASIAGKFVPRPKGL